MKIVPPGADYVPTPEPLDEEPPADSFCDLVMTGGVASGVVYPWAVLELARAYRFRSIGGTSVGAMAAVLAAAAEYGRRTGFVGSFEPLRRLPASLAETLADGSTRMLSLFQPAPPGQRLFGLFVLVLRRVYRHDVVNGKRATWWDIADASVSAYGREIRVGMLAAGVVVAVLVAVQALLCWPTLCPSVSMGVLAAIVMLAGAAAGLVVGAWRDIKRGIVDNAFGLCKGGDVHGKSGDDERPALTTWLHEGIQAGAGLHDGDDPLTFRHLWTAPAYPGAPFKPCADDAPPGDRAINLEVITTNVSHGRPYRLPMLDETSRLFFRPEELSPYFPPAVLQYLRSRSRPYAPASTDEPPASQYEGFLELPGADLPVVVAARLSLSFPILFSAVPLYAVQLGDKTHEKALRRCWFSDGGLSSNFPIHLFDTAIPRWPTFGMWLGTRAANPGGVAVWLPSLPSDGGQDSWQIDDLDGGIPANGGGIGSLFKFLAGVFTGAKDWSDITTMRLPHMRCRVARLGLLPDEGALNIAMPGAQILRMANEYGTRTGRLFRARYESGDARRPAQSWCEQRWTRFLVVANGLRDFLDRVTESADVAPRSVPLDQAIADARTGPPLRGAPDLQPQQAAALAQVLQGLRRLEAVLDASHVPVPDVLRPVAEIHSRPPL